MMISPSGMIFQRALSLRYPAALDFVIRLVSRILTLCFNPVERLRIASKAGWKRTVGGAEVARLR
jgi:hypothetical protein